MHEGFWSNFFYGRMPFLTPPTLLFFPGFGPNVSRDISYSQPSRWPMLIGLPLLFNSRIWFADVTKSFFQQKMLLITTLLSCRI